MASPSGHGGNHGKLAALLAAVSAVGPFCIDAYLPSLSEISRAFDVPLATVQQTLTAYMAPFAFMTLWHGALSDRFGRRRVVLGGMGLFVLASLGCALAPNITTLVVFRALQGMTAGAGMIVGRAIVRDLREGAAAQRMMSIVSLVFAIAPAVAPVIGGWLHHFYGWRSVFVFMALFAAVVGAWCWRSLPESLPLDQRQPFRPGYLLSAYARVATSLPFMAASLAIAFGFGGFFIYVLSAPVFLMTHLGLAETEFFWLFAPITLGLVGGAWLSGRLAGRLSPPRTAAAGFAVMIFAAAANLVLNLVAPPGLPHSVIPVGVYTLGVALALPSLTILALDQFPRQRGLAASCQGFVMSAGNSLNAAFLAPAFWASPLRLASGTAILLVLAAIAMAALLRSVGRVPAGATG